MNLDLFIFVFSAVVAVFGATMMVFQRNPIASVLFLILSLVAQAVLYIQLGALFMGAILVIVYAGAILVLFLFVIMMLNLRGEEDLGEPLPVLSRMFKYSIALLIFIEMVFIIRNTVIYDATAGIMNKFDSAFGSVEQIAEMLFTRYLYPFELTSILLLVAIVGAVVLARKERNDDTEFDNDEKPKKNIKEVQG